MKKAIISGILLSFLISSCNRDNDTVGNEEIVIENKVVNNKTTIDKFSADYGKLLESISQTKDKKSIEDQIKAFGKKYNYEYTKNEYVTFSKLDENSDYELSQSIKDAIEKSDDNFHSIIKSLTILKESKNLSEEDYLVTSLLIETLKVKSKETISYDYAIKLYHEDIDKDNYTTFSKNGKNKLKCASMVIGSGIGGAIAGCGVGAGLGALPGCAVGGVIGAIGGILYGYGSSNDC